MIEETKLPEELELVRLLIDVARGKAMFDAQREHCDKATAALYAEHAQRLTLQRHAADMAQRVADLEAERDELRASLAESMQISRDTQDRLTEAQKERDELRAKLAAVTNKAGELATDVRGLVDESEGVAGLHLNGDVADWGSLLPGGRFERLTALDDLEELLNAAQEHKA